MRKLYSEEDIVCPFESVEYDIDTMTGGDFYTLMLSASLGNKNVEGLACSGSSEVLMKTNFEFARTHATGTVKVKSRSKATPALDLEGSMVAKTGKKFRGVGKANSYALVMEDTLWGSAASNRLRSCAFFAASLIAMGVAFEDAKDISSDILGSEMPDELIESVSTPLSTLKRDTAVVAKSRNAVFMPHHLIQDIVWEDGALVSRSHSDHEAIDWARITAIAKYLGTVNTLADPRFRRVAESIGVPYVPVQNHWAHVSRVPYINLGKWEKVEAPRGELTAIDRDIAEMVENISDRVFFTAQNLDNLTREPSAQVLMDSLRNVRLKKHRSNLAISQGTDVLYDTRPHSVNPGKVGLLVQGSESTHNAFKSSMINQIKSNKSIKALAESYLELADDFLSDEGDLIAKAKELGDVLVTRDTFLDAAARLARVIGDSKVAYNRMATYRRKTLGNSSNLPDRVTISSMSKTSLPNVLLGVCKAALKGHTGFLYPPAILSNPVAAIEAGETARLLKEGAQYLEQVKRYWGDRYQKKATWFKDRDKWQSIRYGMAAKAMRYLRPEHLVEWQNDYIPVGQVTGSYMHDAVLNYVRKRTADKANTMPWPTEKAMAYARRMDKLLQPRVSFAESMEFVNTKLDMVAMDFKTKEEWKGNTEHDDVEPSSVGPGGSTALADLLGGFDFGELVLPTPTEEQMRVLWKGRGHPDRAAMDNGYSDYSAAVADLGSAAAYDEENQFTRRYISAEESRTNRVIEDGDAFVI